MGLVPGECVITYHPSWSYLLLCSLLGAITSRLDTPSDGLCIESCSFEIPWSGEPKWTPCTHAPPTSLHVSFLILHNCSPSISPSFYTYTHSPPTFYPIPIPAFIFVYHPAPTISLFRPFIAIPLLPAPSTTTINQLQSFFKAFHPLHAPSHPPAPACPPTPIFAFLHIFLFNSIHTCTYMIHCI